MPSLARHQGLDRDRRRTRLIERASVAWRVVLAAGGGYGIAALATALLSVTLPFTRPEAVTTATLISFTVLAVVVVLVFAMRSLLRATATVLGVVVLGAALWLATGPYLSSGVGP